MSPRVRKSALAAHIVFSIGWLGAVAAFLALSIAGLTSRNVETVRSAYLAMDLVGRFVIVPTSLLALTSGLFQALGTEWGLVRHYWVVVKLVLTFGSVLLLVLHQYVAVGAAAQAVAASAPGTWPPIGRWGRQLVTDASLAILSLGVITVISIFKPWGRTRYGRPRSSSQAQGPVSPATTSGALLLPSETPTRPARRWAGVLLLFIAAALLFGLHFSGYLGHRH